MKGWTSVGGKGGQSAARNATS